MSNSFKTLLSARLVPPYSGSRPRALALGEGPIPGKLHMRYVEERLGLLTTTENRRTTDQLSEANRDSLFRNEIYDARSSVI